MYTFLLFLHISSAALSIGPFFVLLPLTKKIRTAQQEVLTAYLDIFRAAVRLVKHAGHVLVGTGILLIWQSGWTWGTSWVVMTVGVMAASIVFLARAFTPAIRGFYAGINTQSELAGKLYRAVWLYISILAIMLWFMTAKPVFW
ncbi:hypothetical protein [Domibacillus robiginosus]|uniref:hypothetical protein n=1 Tax=Domibacillus robiginosus TaxID=1071054 RepID=UPI00067BABA9|nr:hypothetical protein [Domibacillus robiginosus]